MKNPTPNGAGFFFISGKLYAVAASSFLRKENITTPEMTQRAMRTVQLTQSGTLFQSIEGMELR